MFETFRRNSARDEARAHRQDECGGFSELSPAQVMPIFARVTRIPDMGFSEIRSAWWARPAGEGVFHVLHFLRNPRGVDYRFRWGVSLPWVPRVSRGKTRWHRTLKSADFDLWDLPYDYLVSTQTPWLQLDVYFPDRTLGERCFEEDLERCWSLLRAPIEEWWSSASDSRGVLDRAEEQAARRWEGPRHAPDPVLVAAFTLALLGSLDEAWSRLKGTSEYGSDAAELDRALERVAAIPWPWPWPWPSSLYPVVFSHGGPPCASPATVPASMVRCGTVPSVQWRSSRHTHARRQTRRRRR